MDTVPSQTHICITRTGQEELLREEIISRLSGCNVELLAPGALQLRLPDDKVRELLPLFFSCQWLPQAVPIHAQSINAWASAILDYLVAYFRDDPTPWSLAIFDPKSAETGIQYARATRIEEALFKLLKERRRTLLRTYSEEMTSGTLLQACLLSPTYGFIGAASPSLRGDLGAALSPFRAGFVTILDDLAPPSRAFKKLKEAMLLWDLGIKRGSTCVDLGACPGGWSYVLLDAGCRVTAVDRSPVDATLLRNRNLRFVQGNAFTWTPPERVDLLVCDVIAAPERTVELLQKWTGEKLCRHFCVTVKFKGSPAFDALNVLREILAKTCTWFDGRQLTNNKNEITVVGKVL